MADGAIYGDDDIIGWRTHADEWRLAGVFVLDVLLQFLVGKELVEYKFGANEFGDSAAVLHVDADQQRHRPEQIGADQLPRQTDRRSSYRYQRPSPSLWRGAL